MAIEFVCPSCRESLRVADGAAGTVVRCGNCLATLRVPAPTSEAPLEFEPAPRPRRPAAEPIEPPRDRDEHGEPRKRRRRPPATSGRKVLFWILVVLGSLAVLGGLACGGILLLLQPKWKTHESAEGHFKVDLPAEARHDMAELAKTKHQTNVKVEGTILLGKLEEYSVVYADIDLWTRQTMTDEAILDKSIESMKAETAGLQILSNQATTVSGFPARELTFAMPGGETYLARIVVARSRLYVATAGGPFVNATGNDRIRKFLNSFQIAPGGNPWRGKLPQPPPRDDDQ